MNMLPHMAKGTFKMQVKELEVGGLSWGTSVGTMESQGSCKRSIGGSELEETMTRQSLLYLCSFKTLSLW